MAAGDPSSSPLATALTFANPAFTNHTDDVADPWGIGWDQTLGGDNQLPTHQGRVDSTFEFGSYVYIGGQFHRAVQGGTANNNVRHLVRAAAATGTLDATWLPVFNGRVWAITVVNPGDGPRLIVCGEFTSIDGTAVTSIAAFKLSDMSLDTTIMPNMHFNDKVKCVAVDGTTLYLGGYFTAVDNSSGVSQVRKRLAKLTFNGTRWVLDATWVPTVDTQNGGHGGEYQWVNAIEVSSAKVMIGGFFTSVNGDATKKWLTSLNKTTGAFDGTTWDPFPYTDYPGTSGTQAIQVFDLCLNGNDLYVAANGVNSAMRYDAVGGTRYWHYWTDGDVQAVTFMNGNAYFAFHGDWVNLTSGGTKPGTWSTSTAVSRHGLFKLSPAGVLDVSWNPSFTYIGGQNPLGKPNTEGLLKIWSLSVGASLYVGGDFYNVNGAARQKFAMLPASAVAPPPPPAGNAGIGIIAMENRAVGGVIGGASFPLVNANVLPKATYLSQCYGAYGPNPAPAGATWTSTPTITNSHPIYEGFCSGDNQGVVNDNLVSPLIAADNFLTQADKAGVPWAAYAEAMPGTLESNVVTGGGNTYLARHFAPAADFSQINPSKVTSGNVKDAGSTGSFAGLAPAQPSWPALINDLNSGAPPAFWYMCPSTTNQGHLGGPTSGVWLAAPSTDPDKFINKVVSDIRATSWYQNGGILVIWWDEGDASTTPLVQSGAGRKLVIVLSKATEASAVRSDAGVTNDFGLLRDIEDFFGYKDASGNPWHLGHAADANIGAGVLAHYLGGGGAPPPPPPPPGDVTQIWVGNTGSSTVPAGAGTFTLWDGTTDSYVGSHYRSLDGGATWAAPVISASNVTTTLYAGTDVWCGATAEDVALNKSRPGGDSYNTSQLVYDSTNNIMLSVGSGGVWRCDNPWDPTPLWEPFMDGLGAVQSRSVIVNPADKHDVMAADTERAVWRWLDGGAGQPDNYADQFTSDGSTNVEVLSLWPVPGTDDVVAARDNSTAPAVGGAVYLNTAAWGAAPGTFNEITPKTGGGGQVTHVCQFNDGSGSPVTLALETGGSFLYRKSGAGGGSGAWGASIDGGGMMVGVDVKPNDTNTVLCAGDVGGAFLSQHKGGNWMPRSRGFVTPQQLNCAFVKWHPDQTTFPGYVYAGNGWDGSNGGFWRSVDGGLSWQVQSSAFGYHSNNPAGTNNDLAGNGDGTSTAPARSVGNLLAIDPTNGQRMYTASYRQGVWRSTNAGQTWVQISANFGIGITAYCRTVAIDPNDVNTVYVGLRSYGAGAASNHGAYKITNAWAATPTITALTNAPSTVEEFKFVGGTLYAACHTSGIYRVTNTGTTWTAINSGVSLSSKWLAIDGFVSGGNHVLYIGCAAPSGSSCIMKSTFAAGGTPSWASVTSSGVHDELVTDDGTIGATQWWYSLNQAGNRLGGGSYVAQQICVDPNSTSTVYVAGRGGAWRTTDGGTNWYPASQRLAETYESELKPDPLDANALWLAVTDWTCLRSLDGGTTWAQDNPTITASSEGDSVVFDQDDVLSARSKLYMGFGDGIVGWKSQASAVGTGWTSLGTPAAGAIKGLAIGRDGSGNKILLASVEGHGMYRKNLTSGAAWVQVPGPTFAAQGSGRMRAPISWNRTAANVYSNCVFTFDHSTGVWRSTDYGQTWTNIWAAARGSEYAGMLRHDPNDLTVLWVTRSDTSTLYKLTNVLAGASVGSGIVATAMAASGANGPVDVTSSAVYAMALPTTTNAARFWKSTDSGATWTEIGDDNYRGQMIAPLSLWAAADGRLWSAQARIGAAVFSAGGGVAAFTAVTGFTSTNISPFTGLNFANGSASDSGGAHFFAKGGTDKVWMWLPGVAVTDGGGLWYSSDAGVNWTRKWGRVFGNGLQRLFGRGAQDKTSENTFYLTLGVDSLADGADGGVWKITNADNAGFLNASGTTGSGTIAATKLSGGGLNANAKVGAITVDPSNGDVVVCQPVNDPNGANIFLSRNGGATWSTIADANYADYAAFPLDVAKVDTNVYVSTAGAGIVAALVNTSTASTQLDLRWADRQTITVDSTLLWDVASTAAVTDGLTLQWNVRQSVAKNLDLRWNVASPSGVETFPTLTTEIAFATDPNDPTPVWTDVSAYVREINIRRGRQQEIDQVQAGTCTLILDNRDRRFDSENAASPYYPNLIPMRRLRVSATFNGQTSILFSGFVDGWPQQWEQAHVSSTGAPLGDARIALSATDGFKVLAAADLPNSVYEVEVRTDNPAFWMRLGEQVQDAPSTAIDLIGARNGTFQGLPQPGTGLVAYDSDGAMNCVNQGDGVTVPRVSEVFPSLGTTYAIEFWVNMPLPPSGEGPGGVTYIPRVLQSWPGPGAAGTFELWANPKADSWVTPGAFTWQVYGANGAAWSVDTSVAVADAKTHHVVLRSNAGTLQVFVDGVDVSVAPATGASGLSSGLIIAADPYAPLHYVTFAGTTIPGVVDDVAIYPTLDATRIAAHHAAGTTPWLNDLSGTRATRILDYIDWSSIDRDIDSNPDQSELQAGTLGGSALDYLRKIEETENGLLFVKANGKLKFRSRHAILKLPYTVSQATFGDGPGELPYADLEPDSSDTLLHNEAKVTRAGGVTQTVSDATSIGRYFRRTIERSDLLNATDNESLDAAGWLVGRYKDPLLRINRIVVKPRHTPSTLFPQVLGREIGDRVTIIRRPPGGGSPLTKEVHIEGVNHKITPKKWETEWWLSPADTQTYFVWGVSEWGVDTRWTY